MSEDSDPLDYLRGYMIYKFAGIRSGVRSLIIKTGNLSFQHY